jgi:LysM repeat protein
MAASDKAFPSPTGGFYTVRKGDTLSRITRTTGVSMTELQELNRLGKGTKLKIGQQLLLRRSWEQGEDEEEGDGSETEGSQADLEQRLKASEALLGRWNNPEEPKLLVKVAMGFLGAPYRLGGSSVTGIDCSAFVRKIYQFFNVTLPRTAFEQSHVGLRIARGELQEGDLLFFNTRRKLGHVGIYIGDDKFVHASSRKRGVRIDSLNTPYFDRRFVQAARLKEIDDRL